MSSAPIDLAQLRVAVVGLGSIGNRHLYNLRVLGIRKCIVVRRAESTNQQFQPPPNVQVVTDAQAAIAGGIDLAIICTPSSLHKVAAEPFLQARVPVLIEKPLEASLAAAREIDSLAQANDVYASAAYCMRYHPAYRAAADFLRAGKLGEVHSAKAWFHTYLPDWHPYEDYRQSYAARADLGGGVIPTLDHEIDFLLWTLGPAELQSAELIGGQATLGVNVPAAAELSLVHANKHANRTGAMETGGGENGASELGATAGLSSSALPSAPDVPEPTAGQRTQPDEAADSRVDLTAEQASSGTLAPNQEVRAEISLSFASRKFSRGFEFHGSAGKLCFSFAAGELKFSPNGDSNTAGNPEVLATTSDNDTSAMYFNLLQQVLQEVATGRPPSTPLTSGIAALEICEGARQSAGSY